MCSGIHACSPPKHGKATLAVAFPCFNDLRGRGVERSVKKHPGGVFRATRPKTALSVVRGFTPRARRFAPFLPSENPFPTGKLGSSPCPAKIKNPKAIALGFFGRGARTRTQDQRFWRPRFYQLNYTPVSLGSDTVHCNISFCLWQALFHFFLQKCFGNAAAENRSTVNRGDMPQTRLITPMFKQFYKDFS